MQLVCMQSNTPCLFNFITLTSHAKPGPPWLMNGNSSFRKSSFVLFCSCFPGSGSISQAKSQTPSDKVSQWSQGGDAMIVQRNQDDTMSLVPSAVVSLVVLKHRWSM